MNSLWNIVKGRIRVHDWASWLLVKGLLTSRTAPLITIVLFQRCDRVIWQSASFKSLFSELKLHSGGERGGGCARLFLLPTCAKYIWQFSHHFFCALQTLHVCKFRLICAEIHVEGKGGGVSVWLGRGNGDWGGEERTVAYFLRFRLIWISFYYSFPSSGEYSFIYFLNFHK